jgi:MFS family permease
MTTKKRRTTARRSTARRKTTRRPAPRRRRTSTASTLGTAAGVALAGLLAALLGGLPWWGWVLIVLVGLAAGVVWAVRRGRAVEASDAAEPPAGPVSDP